MPPVSIPVPLSTAVDIALLRLDLSTCVDLDRPMPPKPRQRSSDTKARILAAAQRLFAAEGYERTTVRAIAAAAAADPALVVRYFGSKEGLFALTTAFDLRLPDMSGI